MEAKKPGRPLLPETLALRKQAVAKLKTLSKKNPDGVSNSSLAKALEVDSLKCSVLCKRMAADGLIRMNKDGRFLFYSLPQA